MVRSRAEIINSNDVSRALVERMDELKEKKPEEIASEFSKEQSANYYNVLRNPKKYRDQGFLKSLALFLDYQSKLYESSNTSSLTELDKTLLKNSSSLYESLETASTLSRWNIPGLLAAGTQAMTMLRDVPVSSLAWLNNPSLDNDSIATQEMIKSIFIFSKMTIAALQNDASYKDKMGLVGIKINDVLATLQQVAEISQKKMEQISNVEDLKTSLSEDKTASTNSSPISVEDSEKFRVFKSIDTDEGEKPELDPSRKHDNS
jgi:hypothetical protein